MTDTTLSSIHGTLSSSIPQNGEMLISVPNQLGQRTLVAVQPYSADGSTGQHLTGTTFSLSGIPLSAISPANGTDGQILQRVAGVVSWASPQFEGPAVVVDGSTIPGSTGTPYAMGASDYVVELNKTAGAASVVTLPAAPVIGRRYYVVDAKGDCGTNNCTIQVPNSGTVNGGAPPVMNANYDQFSFIAVSNTVWRLGPCFRTAFLGNGLTAAETVLTASGAISVNSNINVIEMVVLDSATALTMTLTTPPATGKVVRIKRKNASGGAHTVTLNLDGTASTVVTFNGPNGGECLELIGSGTSTWRQIGWYDAGVGESDVPAATRLTGAELTMTRQGSQDVHASPVDFSSFKLAPVVLSGSTTLSAASHNKRDLWATTSLTLTVPSSATLGDFAACLYTGPGATVTLSGAAYDLAGTPVTTLAPSREMEFKTYAGTVYAIVRGQTVSSATNATSFTTSPTSGTMPSGTAITLTFTPNGTWVSGQTIGLTLNTVTGSVATATNGAITGSGASWTVDPTDGNSTPVTVQFTPSSANGTSGSITVAGTSITASNTSVAITVAASAATSFTTSPTSITTASNSPVTVTWTPNGNWQTGQVITLAISTVSGTWTSAVNGTIGGSGASWTVTPAGTNNSVITAQFTPTSVNGTSGTITVGGTSITATNTSITVAVQSLSYPTLTTSGISRVAIFDANSGLSPNSTTGTTLTGITDATGNAHNLTSSVGVTVGSTVNGLPSVNFAGANTAANSGLIATPAGSPNWLNAMRTSSGESFAIVMAWQSKTLSSNTEVLLHLSNNSSISAGPLFAYWDGTASKKVIWRQGADSGAIADTAISAANPANNSVHTIAARYTNITNNATWNIDLWFDGTKLGTTTVMNSSWNLLTGGSGSAWSNIAIGQGALASDTRGAATWRFLEAHFLQDTSASISDSDINLYVTPITGFFAQKWGT